MAPLKEKSILRKYWQKSEGIHCVSRLKNHAGVVTQYQDKFDAANNLPASANSNYTCEKII